MQVQSWLHRAAAVRPGREAVNGVSYADLLARADAGARDLLARGAGPGATVGLALVPGIDFVVALHATWRAGAVAVPIDLRAPQRLETDLLVDAPLSDGAPVALRDAIDLAEPAAILYTSGSTGAPKPVTLTYGNWMWSALGSAAALGVHPRERWLSALPLTHVGGLSIVVRSAIYASTARVLDGWETEIVLAELRDATLVSLVPTTLRRLLEAGWRGGTRVLLGGAPIPPALRDTSGLDVVETYGLTEATSQVTTGGAPLFCSRVAIAGAPRRESGEAHEPVVGEILVSGPTVAGGGELRTGDLGALDERGHLQVTGRKADTIVTGGENVSPAEVEAVLESHPAVAEAAVHARPDPEWGERLVATVVLREPADIDTLRAHLAATLPGFKVPKEIAFEQALPRTASGKLRRGELR